MKELVKKVYDNRQHIAEVLGDRDDYFTHQQHDDSIIIRNHKALIGNLDTPIDWTVILIEGGIWQYQFLNRQVRENSKYVPVQDALKKILEDAGID